MVSFYLLISTFSSPCTNPLGIVTYASNIIGITVTFIFHSLFLVLCQRLGTYLSFPFLLILLCGSLGRQSPIFGRFFWLTTARSGHLAEIRLSICISKFRRTLCVSLTRTGSRLDKYHLFVRSNFNFLHIYQWITFSAQLYLVLYSFCANLLHSLMKWFIVSSLSSHNSHLLFRCVLSFFALIQFALTALFCAAFRRDSVSRFRFFSS